MDLGLKDVSVCITGANGGIGLAATKAFLEQGASVIAHYNRSSDNLQPLVAGSNGKLQTVQADLRDEKAVDTFFQGRKCQVLVVNHAVYENRPAPIKDMTLSQWRNTFDSNLTSTFLIIRAFMRQISSLSEEEKEKVAIVMIGSTAGKYGEANHSDYASTKSSMMYGLLLSLKNEIVRLAPRGRVNTIAPGWVATPMATTALGDPNIIYQALASTPLKKVAKPEDIANQIMVVASSKLSGHVTGQCIMVEGGMEGRLLNSREDIDFERVRG